MNGYRKVFSSVLVTPMCMYLFGIWTLYFLMHNVISTSIYYVIGQDLRVLLNTQKKPLITLGNPIAGCSNFL